MNVKTFGGAVSHLEKTFQTLDFPNNKKRITEYIENNPDDAEPRRAWNTYFEVMRNVKKENGVKVPQYRYIWIAEDKNTGEKVTAKSAVALGFKIGASRYIIRRYELSGIMWNHRYKITRTRS